MKIPNSIKLCKRRFKSIAHSKNIQITFSLCVNEEKELLKEKSMIFANRNFYFINKQRRNCNRSTQFFVGMEYLRKKREKCFCVITADKFCPRTLEGGAKGKKQNFSYFSHFSLKNSTEHLSFFPAQFTHAFQAFLCS